MVMGHTYLLSSMCFSNCHSNDWRSWEMEGGPSGLIIFVISPGLGSFEAMIRKRGTWSSSEWVTNKPRKTQSFRGTGERSGRVEARARSKPPSGRPACSTTSAPPSRSGTYPLPTRFTTNFRRTPFDLPSRNSDLRCSFAHVTPARSMRHLWACRDMLHTAL